MTLPGAVRKHVDQVLEAYCEQREALNARQHEQVEYKVESNYVIVTDAKPAGLDFGAWSRNKIAYLEFNPGIEKWRLFWYDKNAKRHPYPIKTDFASLEDLIKVMEFDCTGIFSN